MSNARIPLASPESYALARSSIPKVRRSPSALRSLALMAVELLEEHWSLICFGSNGCGSTRGHYREATSTRARPCIHASCFSACAHKRVAGACVLEQISLIFHARWLRDVAGDRGRCPRHAGGGGGTVLQVERAAARPHRALRAVSTASLLHRPARVVGDHQRPPVAHGGRCQCCGWADSHPGPWVRPHASVSVAVTIRSVSYVTDVTDVV